MLRESARARQLKGEDVEMFLKRGLGDCDEWRVMGARMTETE